MNMTDVPVKTLDEEAETYLELVKRKKVEDLKVRIKALSSLRGQATFIGSLKRELRRIEDGEGC